MKFNCLSIKLEFIIIPNFNQFYLVIEVLQANDDTYSMITITLKVIHEFDNNIASPSVEYLLLLREINKFINLMGQPKPNC